MIRNCQHWLEENEEEKQKVLAAAALANDKEAIEAHSNYRYNKNDYNDAMWALLDQINEEEGMNPLAAANRRFRLRPAKPVNPQDEPGPKSA